MEARDATVPCASAAAAAARVASGEARCEGWMKKDTNKRASKRFKYKINVKVQNCDMSCAVARLYRYQLLCAVHSDVERGRRGAEGGIGPGGDERSRYGVRRQG